MSLLKPGALVLALGTIGGCSSGAADVASEPAVDDAADAASVQRVSQSLADLRALQVFEVGDLIVKDPAELSACYNLPCAGTEAARQAQRLGRLTIRAQAAVSKAAPSGACEEPQIDANLQALRALQIIRTGDLLREKPANNPYCYNLPCPEDIAKAKEVTCARAGDLASIVKDAQGL